MPSPPSLRQTLLAAARRSRAPVTRLPDGRYLVHHPDAVKHVLLDQHLKYRQMTPKRPLMGHRSLTMASGDRWRQRRRLMQPLFHPRRLAPLVGHAGEAVDRMLAGWRAPAAAGEPIDVAGEMARLSLDALIATFFGPERGDDGALRRRVRTAFEFFNDRQRRGAGTPGIWTAEGRRVRSELADLRRTVGRTVAERRAAAEPRDDLLSLLLGAEDPRSGETLDDDELVDELMMLLVMGHMTTAVALSWTWYLLALHPLIERRLYQALGEADSEASGRSDYPQAVVSEVLRLFPSTWLISRGARVDDVVAGVPIPAGSTLLLSPWVTHRDPELWPAPELFDPERFRAPAPGRHRFAYFPFGGGPRACVAAQFALMEIPLIVARVLRRYRLELVPDHPVAVRAAITLEPRRGLRMTLHPRDLAPARGRRAARDRPERGTAAPGERSELKTEIAEYWDRRSDDFETAQGVRNRRQKRAWLELLARLAGEPPRAVLDVGTGTGFLALLLAELGHDCRGIDLSPEMIERARRYAAERGVDAELELGDAEDLPAADASYDLVINRNALWTLPDPERAVREWRRVLKPGGTLAVIDGDWFDDRWSYRISRFCGSVLLAVTTGTNPWARRRRVRDAYDREFQRALPLMRSGSRRRIPELVRVCGFTEIRLDPMTAVNAAERADMRLAARLIQPQRFFAVTAKNRG